METSKSLLLPLFDLVQIEGSELTPPCGVLRYFVSPVLVCNIVGNGSKILQ